MVLSSFNLPSFLNANTNEVCLKYLFDVGQYLSSDVDINFVRIVRYRLSQEDQFFEMCLKFYLDVSKSVWGEGDLLDSLYFIDTLMKLSIRFGVVYKVICEQI